MKYAKINRHFLKLDERERLELMVNQELRKNKAAAEEAMNILCGKRRKKQKKQGNMNPKCYAMENKGSTETQSKREGDVFSRRNKRKF